MRIGAHKHAQNTVHTCIFTMRMPMPMRMRMERAYVSTGASAYTPVLANGCMHTCMRPHTHSSLHAHTHMHTQPNTCIGIYTHRHCRGTGAKIK